MLYRYLTAVVIAPDAFGLFASAEAQADGRLEAAGLVSKKSRSSRVSEDQSSASLSGDGQVKANQRRSLTALSRLLFFVVGNKGFALPTQALPPKAAGVGHEFGRVLNPLIKTWHAQFREFFLAIVAETPPLDAPPAVEHFSGRPLGKGSVKGLADLWVRELPGLRHGELDSPLGHDASSSSKQNRRTTITLAVEVSDSSNNFF